MLRPPSANHRPIARYATTPPNLGTIGHSRMGENEILVQSVISMCNVQKGTVTRGFSNCRTSRPSSARCVEMAENLEFLPFRPRRTSRLLSCPPNRATCFAVGHLRFLLAVLLHSTLQCDTLRQFTEALGDPQSASKSWCAVHSSALIDGGFWTVWAVVGPSRRMLASDWRGIITGNRAWSGLLRPQARYRASRIPWSAPFPSAHTDACRALRRPSPCS